MCMGGSGNPSEPSSIGSRGQEFSTGPVTWITPGGRVSRLPTISAGFWLVWSGFVVCAFDPLCGRCVPWYPGSSLPRPVLPGDASNRTTADPRMRHHEAHVPAEQSSARPHARIPHPDEHPGRTVRARRPPRQGPHPAVGLGLLRRSCCPVRAGSGALRSSDPSCAQVVEPPPAPWSCTRGSMRMVSNRLGLASWSGGAWAVPSSGIA